MWTKNKMCKYILTFLLVLCARSSGAAIIETGEVSDFDGGKHINNGSLTVNGGSNLTTGFISAAQGAGSHSTVVIDGAGTTVILN